VSLATPSRSAVITGPRQTRLRAGAPPPPGSGQVRIRLHGCGICASNLPVWQGREWFRYPQAPGAPGHEGWGEIDAVGEGVEHLRAGERVAALSYHAYAEHDVADAGAVVALPDALADRPFPGEPLGCAMNIFARSDIEAGQTVAVVGTGFLGGLLLQLAKDRGARVLALSRRPSSLDLAAALGADHSISTVDAGAAAARVRDLTDGRGCERVIETGGVQSTLDLASVLAAEGGRLIVAGFHQDGPRQVDMQHWNWLGIDVINAHERDPARSVAGLREAVNAVRSGRLDPWPLLTHRFALDQLDAGFRALDERPDGFVKGLLLL